MTFDSYHAACAYLVDDLWHGAPPTPRSADPQERVRSLLGELAEPHKAFPVLHVGGTTGKGSTASMAAAILSAAGFHTGLYCSPYLQTFIERISVDGRLIAPGAFADDVGLLKPVVERMKTGTTGRPVLLELLFALACNHFRREGVDVAVIEVGLGGRTDCTNVFNPAAATVITNVQKDHTNVLGKTIAAIATEKAAIIKPGTLAVTGARRAGRKVISRHCLKADIPLWQRTAPAGIGRVRNADGSSEIFTPLRRVTGAKPRMQGEHQMDNALLAIAAADALHSNCGSFWADEAAIARGLTARLPGRLEVVQRTPTVILDGAHNPPAAAALREALNADVAGGHERLIMVIGILADKDRAAMLRALAPLADHLIVTVPPLLERAGNAAETARLARHYAGQTTPVELVANPERAVERAVGLASSSDLVCVTGSLYLVGHVRGRWFPVDRILAQRRVSFLDDPPIEPLNRPS